MSSDKLSAAVARRRNMRASSHPTTRPTRPAGFRTFGHSTQCSVGTTGTPSHGSSDSMNQCVPPIATTATSARHHTADAATRSPYHTCPRWNSGPGPRPNRTGRFSTVMPSPATRSTRGHVEISRPTKARRLHRSKNCPEYVLATCDGSSRPASQWR